MVSPPNYRTQGVALIRTCVWRVQFLQRETTWVQTTICCRARFLEQRCIRTAPRLTWTARAAQRVTEMRETNHTPPFRVRTRRPPSSSFIQTWSTPRPQRTEARGLLHGSSEGRRVNLRPWTEWQQQYKYTHMHTWWNTPMRTELKGLTSHLSSGEILHVHTERIDTEVIHPFRPVSPFFHHPSLFWTVH